MAMESFTLSSEQIEFYHTNGYLIVEDLFTPEECDEINARAADIVNQSVDLAPGNAVFFEPEALERSLVSPEHPDVRYLFKIGHAIHASDPVFRYYAMHEHIANVLEQLIGPDIKCVQSMYIDKPKKMGVGQPYHQDSFYLKTDPDTVVAAWIACDDVDVTNGCLHVVPGSQVDVIQPHETPVDPKQRAHFLEVLSARERNEVSVPLRKGSAVFFPGTLLHRSGNNDAEERQRRALVLHYANARSKWVPDPSLRNPHLLVRGRQYPGCI